MVIFNFGEDVEIKCKLANDISPDVFFDVRIGGKIKNADAYVINIIHNGESDFEYLRLLKKRYGYPIRQIELEWGKFTGNANEFIIPQFELLKNVL